METNPQATAGWKRLVWNSVGLRVPEDWEPARLGPRFVMLQAAGRPVLELTWREGPAQKGANARRRFVARQVKRVARHSAGKAPSTTDTERMDPAWVEAVHGLARNGLDAAPFAWEAGTGPNGPVTGRGLLALCAECGRQHLLRCFVDAEAEAPDPGRMLKDFADHDPEGKARFRIYDLRAAAPAGLALTGNSFRPGHFRLRFTGPGQSLELERMGPASVMLGGKSLTAWARGYWALPEDAEPETGQPGPGEEERAEFTWTGARPGLLRRALRVRARAWTPRGANYVLAVRMQARATPDPKPFHAVCKELGIVPQETD